MAVPGNARRRFRDRRRRRPEPRWIAGLGVGVAVILTLTALAAGLSDFWRNYELNTAADLIGAVFTIYVLTPIIQRAGESRVREHRELDYHRFLDRADRSTDVIRIVDTFSNMLLDPYAERFQQVIRSALDRGVSVRILLINPTTLAAEQRALELGTAEDLQRQLTLNLKTLRELRQEIGRSDPADASSGLRADFQVRLYSSGPDVTMYRADDRCLVSFYTIGQLSGDSRQLEVSVRSPLGRFVNDRFHTVWSHSAPFESLTTIVLYDGRIERTCMVKSVALEHVRYLVSMRVDHFLDQAGPRPVTARLGDGNEHTLSRLTDDGSGLLDRLAAEMRRIYNEAPDAGFVRMNPVEL
ncbi:hypothetical protein [Nocardia sp. BMG111209]|uniref:hypothetical protein n=1 Tax=Nocardia sp. BMG111209 TaxID=1160137 RepID=UPI000369ED86|nr:hypothetical protein [Nocardia sp. BMG111209]